MRFSIMPALPPDAAALANLHAQALPPGWPAADFEASCANANRIVFKAAESGGLLGFAMVQFAADEAEILSIAVAKEAQLRGIGSAILAACIAECEQKTIAHIYLEVAEGNAAALWLYLACGLCCGRAEAAVVVNIDRASQTMEVSVDGMQRYNWRVSTARRGYITPPGTYRPQMMARRWFSRLYYNSPMPYSIFFHGGYAIHGTYEISRLGGPASHGCVRLDPDHAAILFELVEREGMSRTTIVVH